MKVNCGVMLVDLNGGPLNNELGNPISLGEACVNALMTVRDGEAVTGLQKMKRYELAKRMNCGDEIALTAEEATDVKQVVGELYPPVLVGCVWPLLDGESPVAAAPSD